MPAPLVYGFVYEYTGSGRMGMVSLQIGGVITAALLIFAYLIREAKHLKN